eukprot:Clim_evm20s99 gene=Clim_evmTU20s99
MSRYVRAVFTSVFGADAAEQQDVVNEIRKEDKGEPESTSPAGPDGEAAAAGGGKRSPVNRLAWLSMVPKEGERKRGKDSVLFQPALKASKASWKEMGAKQQLQDKAGSSKEGTKDKEANGPDGETRPAAPTEKEEKNKKGDNQTSPKKKSNRRAFRRWPHELEAYYVEQLLLLGGDLITIYNDAIKVDSEFWGDRNRVDLWEKKKRLLKAKALPAEMFLVKDHRAWTEEENNRLLEGLKVYGAGNWKEIQMGMNLNHRTPVHIKDRYRTLIKSGAINPNDFPRNVDKRTTTGGRPSGEGWKGMEPSERDKRKAEETQRKAKQRREQRGAGAGGKPLKAGGREEMQLRRNYNEEETKIIHELALEYDGNVRSFMRDPRFTKHDSLMSRTPRNIVTKVNNMRALGLLPKPYKIREQLRQGVPAEVLKSKEYKLPEKVVKPRNVNRKGMKHNYPKHRRARRKPTDAQPPEGGAKAPAGADRPAAPGDDEQPAEATGGPSSSARSRSRSPVRGADKKKSKAPASPNPAPPSPASKRPAPPGGETQEPPRRSRRTQG